MATNCMIINGTAIVRSRYRLENVWTLKTGMFTSRARTTSRNGAARNVGSAFLVSTSNDIAVRSCCANGR